MSGSTSQAFCADKTILKVNAGLAKHKVSSTMEDQLGYVLRIYMCVRERETHSNHPPIPTLALDGKRDSAEEGRGTS